MSKQDKIVAGATIIIALWALMSCTKHNTLPATKKAKEDIQVRVEAINLDGSNAGTTPIALFQY